MVKATLHIFVTVTILLMYSCTTIKQPQDEQSITGNKTNEQQATRTLNDLPFPILTYSNPVEGSDLYSPINGIIADILPDSLGTSQVVIQNEVEYFWNNDIVKVTYELIIGGIKSVSTEKGAIKGGQKIGSMSKNLFFAARSKALDPYLTRTTGKKPAFYEKSYWFSPDWLNPNVTQTLSFKPVASLRDSVEDFYNRWAIEGEEHGNVTLHYFPNLDRIRVPFKLESYPEPVGKNEALNFTELSLYKKSGLFVLQNLLKTDNTYEPVLFWQANFDKYLQQEYKLGDNFYLYCSIYSLDHINKKIIVCVRDFNMRNDETIYQERVDQFNILNK